MSYPAPPPASPPPSSSSDAAPAVGGFFSDLFDVRFTRFVSLRLISVVYVLILVLVSIIALALIFSGFATGITYGIFSLILAALGWTIYIVLARVALEAFAVLFRIHDDTSRTADALTGARPVPRRDQAGSDYGATPAYTSQAYPPPGATAPGAASSGAAPGSTPGGSPGSVPGGAAGGRSGSTAADPSGPPWS
jgi:Domain of unknown function (DUF4282)